MRNVIPPVYGVLVLVRFLVSATAGVIVLIAGGALSGLLWSTLSHGNSGARRDRSARAARRSSRH
jgi:hypothetical protein